MRLTEKDKKHFSYNLDTNISSDDTNGYDVRGGNHVSEVIAKLGQLEDIEEELGIDLITLSKILKNGCYVKPWKKVWFSKVITLQTNEFGILKLFDFNDNDYSLRNYGIDFALTKEELTDGK